MMGSSRRPKTQQTGSCGDFQTEPWAADTLAPYLLHRNIWEPACGQGNLSRRFAELGFTVRSSDVLAPQFDGAFQHDFLAGEPNLKFLGSGNTIVTNPPYNGDSKDRWLEKCYSLWTRGHLPFALLMPYTALESRARQALFKAHGVEVIVLPRRVKFTTPNGKTGGGWFPTAWFCRGILNRGGAIDFAPDPHPNQPALDLLDEDPRDPIPGTRRRVDHSTSVQAAEDVGFRRGGHRFKLLKAFQYSEENLHDRHGGLTSFQAATMAGIGLQSCPWKRVQELEQRFGMLEPTGATRPTATGREARVFRLTDRGREFLKGSAGR